MASRAERQKKKGGELIRSVREVEDTWFKPKGTIRRKGQKVEGPGSATVGGITFRGGTGFRLMFQGSPGYMGRHQGGGERTLKNRGGVSSVDERELELKRVSVKGTLT